MRPADRIGKSKSLPDAIAGTHAVTEERIATIAAFIETYRTYEARATESTSSSTTASSTSSSTPSW